MAIEYVETSNLVCPACQRYTLHNRNNSRANWILHLILGLLTCTVWLWIVLAARMLTHSGPGPWVCSVCGRVEKKSGGLFALWVLAGAVFIGLVVGLIWSNANLQPDPSRDLTNELNRARMQREAAKAHADAVGSPAPSTPVETNAPAPVDGAK
jgi:hypothetical protein